MARIVDRGVGRRKSAVSNRSGGGVASIDSWRAFERAARDGHFDIDAVSPARAAAGIHVPVLLIHGDADVDTPPDHSRRIYAALAGPKRLILVPGGTHNSSLRPDVWREVDRWIDAGVSTPPPASPSARAG
jgi:pimeloyl-ACP methyl ester carboxylesterase